jgi:S-DNA-T family DNA segregation ATPase FtsK/SpoIIIE
MGRPKKKDKPTSGDKGGGGFFDISQETKNSIWGILSFIGAVIAVLSFVGMAGSAGGLFDMVSRSLFGWGFFIIPIALVLLGTAFIKSISREIATSAVIGTLLFVFASLAIFYILGSGDFHARVAQGGYFGVVFGFPLFRLLGFTASFIILAAMLFISVLLTLNVPIYQLITRDEEEEEEKAKMDKIVIKEGGKTVEDNPKPLPVAMAPKIKVAKIEEPAKEFVIKSLKLGNWKLPPLNLVSDDQDKAATGDINANAMIIKRTLATFGIDVEMGEVSIGPTVTQFTMRPAVGVRLSKISGLNPDLSLALAAHPIRIEAPIPGKALVGIEVPNKKTAVIGLRSMFEAEEFANSKYYLPLVIGRDVSGNPIFSGLDKMPHLLVAGATGTGKSVTINALLLSLLYKHSPETLKMILVDPKRVELSLYNDIPHLITPVITDNKKVLGALKWAVNEMDRRYDALSKAGSRDILSYNTKLASKNEPSMPFIVIVIDEMADLMATYGRDVEAAIVRLAQMSRAVGIHLILSTQRPSVEVITGLLKANITTRIALQVASQIDSRTILDMAGAEKLLGKGDMLFISNESSKGRRVQAPFVTEQEVKDVVQFVKDQADKLHITSEGDDLKANLESMTSGNASGGIGGSDGGSDEDDMYDEAKATVIELGKASASLLQRRLRVGYARAARLLDILEEKGVIGPGDGAKPREVYVKADGGVAVPSVIGESGMNADTLETESDEV